MLLSDLTCSVSSFAKNSKKVLKGTRQVHKHTHSKHTCQVTFNAWVHWCILSHDSSSTTAGGPFSRLHPLWSHMGQTPTQAQGVSDITEFSLESGDTLKSLVIIHNRNLLARLRKDIEVQNLWRQEGLHLNYRGESVFINLWWM